MSADRQAEPGHGLSIRVADHFFARFKGLMFTRPLAAHEALLITRCKSVHTAFMRQRIDLAWLDAQGRIVRCVARLAPWRAGFGGRGAVQVLEMAAGSIERLGLRVGDVIALPQAAQPAPPRPLHRQQGSAMLEFVFAGPLLTGMGLAVLQYGMLFFAKNQYNHAAFMASRAGSMANASLDSVRNAYAEALVPAYGGGRNAMELAASQLYARDVINGTNLSGRNADSEGRVPPGAVRIELLNPTRESFDDWNDAALQERIGGGRRVIPNTGLGSAAAASVKSNSGQNLQDANLIKLRITHGYQPKVPLMGNLYARMLRWLDAGEDGFHTTLVNAGLIPVVTHVTMQMQSPAIEPENPVSLPGLGNGGAPSNPGDPPTVTDPPPRCSTFGCSSSGSGGGGSSSGGGTGPGDDGGEEPACP